MQDGSPDGLPDGGGADDESGYLRCTLPWLDTVHALARRLCREPADAEDAVQETYLKAWSAWCAGTRPHDPRGWLVTLCLNVVRDRARGSSRRPELLMDAPLKEHARDDVADTAVDRVEVAQVEAALTELAEPQRVAVVLSDICGLSAREVAEATGSPLGTALSRIHRGRRAVARRVRDGEARAGGVRGARGVRGEGVPHEPRQ